MKNQKDQLVEIIDNNGLLSGYDDVNQIFEYCNMDYSASRSSRNNIPAEGRIIILVEGVKSPLVMLAVLQLLREIRLDVKLVSSQAGFQCLPLRDFMLYENLNVGTVESAECIFKELKAESAIVVFFEKSKKLKKYRGGSVAHELEHFYISLAEKTESPVLPISVKQWKSGINFKRLKTKVSHNVDIKVGEPIPIKQISNLLVSKKEKHKRIKRHLSKVVRHKKPLFETEKTIIHPQDKYLLKKELLASELLGETRDGHKIFLFDYKAESYVMKEIGRLREYTFRLIGEGTGRRIDIDRYDQHYQHIILWSEMHYEIVGSYRVFRPGSAIANDGLRLFYTAELFRFDEKVLPYINDGIELGRSFVHPKYWGTRSLEYLWYGIGTYLRRYPEVRYLFGPVTISNHYPKYAKDLIVFYYKHYFPCEQRLAIANHEYQIDANVEKSLRDYYLCDKRVEDFVRMKEKLTCMNIKLPMLFKQYSELCEEGGVRFLNFSVDPNFNNCVDGLVLVDLHTLTAKKRAKYIG